MKFSLALLSASFALLPSLGSAQSNVSLYGLADAGVEYVNHNTPTGNAFRISTGGESSSRFGLRGTEDLGSGLSALFVLEGGINIDTGSSAQGGLLFGRTAYVGLAGSAGQVTLGRHPSITNEYGVVFEPLGRPSKYSSGALDAAYVARIDNAVRYGVSLGPTKITAIYGAGEVSATSRANRYMGAMGSAVLGDLTIGAAYDQQAGANAALANDVVKRTSVAAIYKLGSVQLVAGYTDRRNEIAVAPTKLGQYWLGVRTQLTPTWYLSGAYYKSDLKNSPNDASMLSGFLSSALSKRTDVYLHAAYAKNKGNATMGVNGFGTANPGTNQTGVMAGMRHLF
jgi:predicted porin